MSDNTITISLEDVLGPDGLDGAWEGMVSKLVDRAEGKFLHSDAGRSFHKVAVEAINKAVEDRLAAKLEHLLSKPIYRTGVYGEKKGEPTSFDEMLEKAVKDALEVTVDIYGKPSKSSGSQTLVQHALKRVALEGLATAVREEAKKVNQQAKEAVGREVARAIAATIK